jgi:DNA-binding Xre family transcriptional regulator
LLLVLVLSIFFILIQFSVVISKLAEGNKNLIQEVGILKAELKKLQLQIKDKE